MKRLVIGILAHVDSGKTTLSEGLLYNTGEISRLGRVDHGDAFLDTDNIERDRGITIFSKQAMLYYKDMEISLLDTPGHIDFKAEAERTLQVLDYAILVISGSDGVQSHTETLWKMLFEYNIPVFIFVNKMDLVSASYERVLNELCTRLDAACMDFGNINGDFYENAAMFDEIMMEEYLEKGTVSDGALSEAIAARRIFPCFFGSALKNEGIDKFIEGIEKYTMEKKYSDRFGAKVFKISEDEKGQRLTYMKITGGKLKVKEEISSQNWSQKVNELRIYSGAKYKNTTEVFAGSICAAVGLSKSLTGEGLGIEASSGTLISEPVFSYSVVLGEDVDVHSALSVFKRLEEEETQLKVTFNKQLQRINIGIMGEVQLEVLKRILSDRFSLDVGFENGSVIYKETIKNTVEGVGHYEPLRHYAEVHLLMEPVKTGSGVIIESKLSEDILDRNFQRLILTHLAEKEHIGVLTGSPVTDIKITLVNAKAHIKHTEGGDFRQATYRAVRQGLMQAESVLLEPFCKCRIEIPTENSGRVMNDLQQMGAEFEAPLVYGDVSVINAEAPVSEIGGYQKEIIAFTRGRGRISSSFSGYYPCANQEKVISKIGYNAEGDIENTADSVFCAHGAGFNVKWDKVFDYMHLELHKTKQDITEAKPLTRTQGSALIADEEELLAIFERTYGKSKRYLPETVIRTQNESPQYIAKPVLKTEEYLLIDGYNIIFAWDELRKISEDSLEDARLLLTDKILNYKAVRKENVILVFDAYKVKGNRGEVESLHGVSIVYTKEAETADSYIEKTSKKLSKHYRVRVATSDGTEQMIIFGNGAVRVTASELKKEVEAAEKEIRDFIKDNTIKTERQ